MTQGTEFAVLDGNAFDDGQCAFQLAPGEYNVYIVAKAKPGDILILLAGFIVRILMSTILK